MISWKPVKVRRRDAADSDCFWALAVEGGALSYLDGSRAGAAASRLLGLWHAPSGRRKGEFLGEGLESEVAGRLEVAPLAK